MIYRQLHRKEAGETAFPLHTVHRTTAGEAHAIGKPTAETSFRGNCFCQDAAEEEELNAIGLYRLFEPW